MGLYWSSFGNKGMKQVITGHNKKCYRGCKRPITQVTSDSEDQSIYGYCGLCYRNKLDCTRQKLSEIGEYVLVEWHLKSFLVIDTKIEF